MDGYCFNIWGAELTSLLGCISPRVCYLQCTGLSDCRLGKLSYGLERRDVIAGLVARFAHV